MAITKIDQISRNRFQMGGDVAMMAMESYMTQGALHVVSYKNHMVSYIY